MALTRMETFATLAGDFGDAVVVSALGYATWCLHATAPRPENFYLRGSMGMGVSVGLGLALARPSRRVVVCEGDGSVLMNLGALATVGAYGPANLTVLILDDGKYLTTGGQTTHSRRGVDLAAIARGAGIEDVHDVADAGALAEAFAAAGAADGPSVIVVGLGGVEERPAVSGLPTLYENAERIAALLAA
jgi:thiamine pyrophosphate-dependent acetolactate synthase large subunit-like protein